MVMNIRSNKELAAEILRIAKEIDVQLVDEPTHMEYIQSLFQGVQNQMVELLDSLKEGHDSDRQKVQINRLDQVLDDVNLVWRDLKPAFDANELTASTKTAGRFELFKRLYDAAFRQLDAVEKAIKRRRDLPDQEQHLKTLGNSIDDLEECWRDLGMALQAEDDLL